MRHSRCSNFVVAEICTRPKSWLTVNSDNEMTAETLKVIVAEKYIVARAALAALLKDDGYEVYRAKNRQTAIRYIERVDRVSVLLADLEMAGWRSVVKYAVRIHNAFVVAMAGDQAVSEMNYLSRCGIHVCLKKPIIYDAVRMAINQKISWPAPGKLISVSTAQLIRSGSHWPSRN